MNDAISPSAEVYRVWIGRCPAAWQPTTWNALPPNIVAVEPGDAGPLTADEARSFLAGFNQGTLTNRGGLWAFAVPVRVKFEGDVEPGERISGATLKLP